MVKTGIIWSDEYAEYNLGDEHPMNPRRLLIPYKLLKSLDFPNLQEFIPSPASDSDILRFHTPLYLEAMKALSIIGDGSRPRLGLGGGDCPVFPRMHESSQLIVGGTLEGAKRILDGDVDHAFSMMAGLHHAFPERAAGFCYYNDVVIGIKYLQQEYNIERILYIDTDVHAGDGVLDAFYRERGVLGISIHESPQFIFPGTGFSNEIGEGEGIGYSVNIPLFPGTWDKLYIEIFEEIVPCLWKEFDPQFVVWQCGADGHFRDLLGNLALSTELYNYLGQRIKELTNNCSARGKLLMLGGGGYNPDSVARVWLASLAGVAGFDLPDDAPLEWIKYCKDKFNTRVSAKIKDQPIDPKKIDQHTLVEEANRQYLQILKEELRDTGVWANCKQFYSD
ncbi:MAG: acetoin utilization protein AcuC [Candidatus Heimdallarchaeota archaeon]|nr:acetoin utilization protein AcuC [Candidatus Heimdallarchaeota archaeon]